MTKSKGWKYRNGWCHFCDGKLAWGEGYFHDKCFDEWFND